MSRGLCSIARVRSHSRLGAALLLLSAAGAAFGQTDNVGTGYYVDASYGSASQTAGPFPWSDLGISATASVAPGDLNVATGGSTRFTLKNSLTPGQALSSATVFNVDYTPGWTGSVSQASASGNLNSSFVYSIGPLNGSTTLINLPLSSSSSPTADLAASLNAPTGPAVGTSASGAGPSASTGFTVSASGCVVVCVTVASASLGVTVGTQVQQSVSVTPTVTYGDLVWITTTPIPQYSASDPQGFIAGSNGQIANPLGGLGSLGLTPGESFRYNITPVVELDLSVTSQAQLTLPASITASYSVFGIGGSQSFPLGNLYTLSTGAESFDVSTAFQNNDYYSIPMTYQPSANLAGPGEVAYVDGTYTAQLVPHGGPTAPPGSGPCAGMPEGCTLSVPAGSGTIGGYGIQNNGSLIPGDQGPGPVCAPAGTPNAGVCVNRVTISSVPTTAPEIDPATGASAMTLLLGALLVLRGSMLQQYQPAICQPSDAADAALKRVVRTGALSVMSISAI